MCLVAETLVKICLARIGFDFQYVSSDIGGVWKVKM